MSLSSSISNALSGLSANSRAVQLVSANLANALNENYSRQEIELTSLGLGGTFVSGNRRVEDHALLSDRRNALSNLAAATEHVEIAKTFGQAIGSPDDPSSLPAQLNAFDAALRYLEGDAGSEVRLQAVVTSAKSLTAKLNDAEHQIQAKRTQADHRILIEVEALNSTLGQIVTLNKQVATSIATRRDTNALLDQRQILIDRVNDLIPVREMQRESGAVSLITVNGEMLIDDSAVRLDFSSTNLVMPHMTIENGQLGAMHLRGEQIDMSLASGRLSGGRLQALFEVRDEFSTQAQSHIDAFALDLANRFHNLASDASATLISSGLFTDAGVKANLSDQIGLAGRLSVNSSIDPDSGGALWRVRSGVHSPTENQIGDASLVTEMIDAMGATHYSAGSIFDHASELSSRVEQDLSAAEQRLSFSSTQSEKLTQLHLANGVNSDSELQKMLSIEANYAANAKIIQTVDEMLATIMRIN